MKNKKINIDNKEITVKLSEKEDDYISLTDIAKYKDFKRTDSVVQNWMRNKETIEFLGIWEKLNNPNFNPIEFDGVRKSAGSNNFSMTPKRWVEKVKARGIITSSGRYGGGTFAHKDIAFEISYQKKMQPLCMPMKLIF